MDIKNQLQNLFGSRLKLDEPFAKHTNFRLGGPAKYWAEVRSEDELQKALILAKEHSVPVFVMGGGSNLLVSDEGFSGLVLQIALRNLDIEGTKIIAGAGALTAAVARRSAEAGLAGFEWAVGLPGTIGGAVRGNAGCFGGETKDAVESVRVLRQGEIVDWPAADLAFGYRDSLFKHVPDAVILSVTLALSPGDAPALAARMREILAARQTNQPKGASSAGCIFKNIELKDAATLQLFSEKNDITVPEEMIRTRRLSAGWVIDQLGLKGTRIGEAEISPAHGNFIVNLGQATASDVVQLISLIKTRARDELGLALEEEIQYLGF